MRNADVDSSNLLSSYETKGTNMYMNLSYLESFAHKWKIDAAVAYNYNKNKMVNELEDGSHRQLLISYDPYSEKNNTTNMTSNFAQARFVFTKMFSRNQSLRFGAEHFYSNDDYKGVNYQKSIVCVA